MIIGIFGKRGSGKSTLSKQCAEQFTNKIVFVSPVENLNKKDYEIWRYQELYDALPLMRDGQIMLVRNADERAIDIICASSLIIGDFTIVIDEFERYGKSKELLDCIHYGRHSGVNIIGNTRRYTDVPRLFTGNADIIYAYRTHEPADLKYLGEFGLDKEVIKNLPDFHAYEYPGGRIVPVSRNTNL